MSMNNWHKYKDQLARIGFEVDVETGHLYYAKTFSPLLLEFELVFVRHGETYGNCGQSTASGQIDLELVRKGIKINENRIYQGNVDNQINQLTHYGRQQALTVASLLRRDFLDVDWNPDYILVSPLTRARDTALPFIKSNQLESRCIIHQGIKEISFGSWENKRICDMETEHPCHLFYRDQHALIKCMTSNSENFCDTLLRAYDVLINLNMKYSGKNLLMFSHSMFGAACCILLGRGEKVEDKRYLAFDGIRNNGSSYVLPNATPILLNTLRWGMTSV